MGLIQYTEYSQYTGFSLLFPSKIQSSRQNHLIAKYLKSPGSHHMGSSPTRPTLLNHPENGSLNKVNKACTYAGFFYSRDISILSKLEYNLHICYLVSQRQKIELHYSSNRLGRVPSVRFFQTFNYNRKKFLPIHQKCGNIDEQHFITLHNSSFPE